MERKKYKDDFDGVMLLRNSFPRSIDRVAVMHLNSNQAKIKHMARKLYVKNQLLFKKCGLEKEDVENIYNSYAYVLFSKMSKVQEKILNNFLKQRGTRLVNLYASTPHSSIEYLEADELCLTKELETPETLLIAKENVREHLVAIRDTLTSKSNKYLVNFFDKNKDLLESNQISLESLTGIQYFTALKHAEKQRKKNKKINFSSYKKSLITEMSKLLRAIKDVS